MPAKTNSEGPTNMTEPDLSNLDFECNICGSTTYRISHRAKEILCLKCLSKARTRLLLLELLKIGIKPTDKILHIAPEKSLGKYLQDQDKTGNYFPVDFMPVNYSDLFPDCGFMDLCDLDDQPGEQYDFIIHSHVLEHITCNVAYALSHIHRMLTPTGHHVCVIPFARGFHDESFKAMPRKDRIARFGQDDHVRRIGREDVDRTIGKIIRLPALYQMTDTHSADTLERLAIPERDWTGLSVNTVLSLRKDDYLL